MRLKKRRIAFLINPLEEMRHGDDTSFHIMAECERRGHRIHILESRDLLMHRDTVYGELTACGTDSRRGVVRRKRSLIRLDRLDALLIRKEPPFDSDYLSMTYLLEFVRQKLFIMNDPAGIRNANEKLTALRALSYAPESVTGYRSSLVSSFLAKTRIRTLVVKPLFNKGGAGIQKGSGRRMSLQESFENATRGSGAPVTVQRFIPHTRSGDKRILILNGRPLGAFKRIPGPGDFRANMALGAKATPAKVDARDRTMIRSLKGYFRSNGLHLVGIDVLNGYLTEVNVTSPAGIPEINAFDGVKTEEPIVDYLESRT